MTVISDSTTAWARVRDLTMDRRTSDLADYVLALSDEQRAEVARRLPGLRKELREAADRGAARRWDGEWDGEWDETDPETADGIGGYGEALRVVGAGTLSGAAATVAWLTRREFARLPAPAWTFWTEPDPADEAPDVMEPANGTPESGSMASPGAAGGSGSMASQGAVGGSGAAVSWSATDEVVRVLGARPAAWQADVAVRLAGKVRTADDRNAPLALALLRACGAAPPEHDPLVTAWLRARPSDDDPLMDALLPRVFEAEGAGRVLREERLEPRPTRWLALIARLQESGAVSRAALIDGCLRRFLRGGDAIGLRFFVRLHRMLDPTPGEVAERTRDYLRLLPAAPGPVAELALAQLRRGGPLDSADTAEAIGALTFRPEAKLALAGLRWLDKELAPMAKAPPAAGTAAVAEAASAAGAGLVAASAPAAGLVGVAASAPTGAGLAAVAASAPAVAGVVAEVASALAGAFGHASYEVQGRAARLALRHATALAPAGQVLAEAVPLLPAALGSRIAAVFGGDVADPQTVEVFTPPPPPAPAVPGPFPEPTVRLGRDVYEWVAAERWLAAFVTQAADDREELRRTLAAEGAGSHPDHLFQHTRWLQLGNWITALAAELIAPGTDPGPPELKPVDPWAGASFDVRVMALPDADEDEPQEAEEPEKPQDGGLSGRQGEPEGAGESERPEGAGEERVPEPAFGEFPEPMREEIFERLLDIGVSEERVSAMRDGLPLPEQMPDEPAAFRIGFTYSGPRPLFDKPEPPDPAAEFRRVNRLPHPGHVAPPHYFLLHRLGELYLALRDGTLPPVLLATPTVMTGHLDPDVLVDRLAVCAAAGVEPLPADLLQALLRLPRGAHPGAAGRAAGLGSRAAATAAEWMAGDGLPDPETGLRWAYLDGATDVFFDEREPGHRVYELRLVPVLRAAPTGHDLLDELLREPRRLWADDGQAMGWWPGILPSHREVVAVNYLPDLGRHLGVYPECAHRLIDADGPTGDAMALVLAHFVARRSSEAVPLLMRLAAGGGPSPEAVGRQLALLIRRTHVEPRPVVALLSEAARQGAYEQVWRMLTSLLPGLLPGPGEKAFVVHLEAMTLAADAATWAGARGPIPEVTALAAGTGHSRFKRACARLRDQLGG